MRLRIALFGLFNVVWVFIFGAVFLWPLFSSYIRTGDIIRLQESRLALYRRNRDAYAGNLLFLSQAPDVRVFPYDGLTDALAEISHMAEALGLREILFSASEPIGHDVDTHSGRALFDMRVLAVYEGSRDAMVAFARELDETHVQGLQLTFDEGNTAIMRVVFSLLAVKE